MLRVVRAESMQVVSVAPRLLNIYDRQTLYTIYGIG
jgi:hypothetical protein